MKKVLFLLAVAFSVVALAELAGVFLSTPFLYGTPWFFGMHLVVIAVAIADGLLLPKVANGGGRVYINKLKPYLPPYAYNMQCLVFASGIGLVALLLWVDRFTVAIFPTLWLVFLLGAAINFRYIRSNAAKSNLALHADPRAGR